MRSLFWGRAPRGGLSLLGLLAVLHGLNCRCSAADHREGEIVYFDFEDISAWARGDQNTYCDADYWGQSFSAHGGTYSVWCAQEGYSCVYPAYRNADLGYYDYYMNAYLRSPAFNLQGCVAGELDFWTYFVVYGTPPSCYDYFYVQVEAAAAPTPIWNTGLMCGTSAGWENRIYPLPPEVLQYPGPLQLVFYFVSNYYGSAGVYVDDAVVRAYTASPTQTLSPTVTLTPTETPSPTATDTPTWTPTLPPWRTETPAPEGSPTQVPLTVTPAPTVPLTASPSPSATLPPTASQTPAPSETPPPTEAPSETPTPAPYPTSPPHLRLMMTLSSAIFTPGQEFLLQTAVLNLSAYSITADQYIVLDVFGAYYFWPAWAPAPDHRSKKFSRGASIETILQFIWPAGSGAGTGIIFWGVLLDPESGVLLSMDQEMFGFAEPPGPTPTPRPSATPSPTPRFTRTPTLTPAASITPPLPIAVSVPGNRPWTDTGIDVTVNDLWYILASGQICFHRSDCEGTRVGPCGEPDPCYDPECTAQPATTGFNHGGLIGKVGAAGEIFLLCGEISLEPPQSGRLFLGINDGNTADNDLAFMVTLRQLQ